MDWVILWVVALQGKYHLVKFGGHWDCGRGDIMISVCHVIFQDHMTKVSCDVMGKRLITVRYYPVRLGYRR